MGLYLQLMKTILIMVMVKKGSGSIETFTRTAVTIKTKKMATKLLRILTCWGILMWKGTETKRKTHCRNLKTHLGYSEDMPCEGITDLSPFLSLLALQKPLPSKVLLLASTSANKIQWLLIPYISTIHYMKANGGNICFGPKRNEFDFWFRHEWTCLEKWCQLQFSFS